MRTALFSATLLASTLATAATPIDGWYGSLFGGYSLLSKHIDSTTFLRRFNSPFNNNFNNVSTLSNIERSTPRSGFNGGGRLGFQSNALRYEGEVTYIGAFNNSSSGPSNRFPFQVASLNQFTPYSPLLENERKRRSETNAIFGMANIYFDFPVFIPCISPFVGIGLGYGWVETKLDFENPIFLGSFNFPQDFNLRNDFRTSDSAFSYQATAGFTFNYVENWALNIAYRYIGTTKLNNLGRIFQGNLASVGVVYRFNEYNYK